MAQSGTGQCAHTKTFILPWATGTSLATAIGTELTARSTTWAAVFTVPSGTLATPMLRMPLIRIYTTAADGLIKDGTGTTGFPITQYSILGPLTIEDTSTLVYTGSASAVVMIQC